jgi:hypothetical protein
MTWIKKYYRIPLITKLFNIKFYVQWQDEKLNKIGFQREKRMSFLEAITRLETKRLRRDQIDKWLKK